MAPKYPAIPEPTLAPESLRDSILSIKQMLEILTGQRGNPDYAAGALQVDKNGDTMTGDLTISKVAPKITLNKQSDLDLAYIQSQNQGLARWAVNMAGATAESGGGAGSDFYIVRYNDAGAFVDSPISISRQTGNVAILKDVTTQGNSNVTGNETVTGGVTVNGATGITINGANGLGLSQGGRVNDQTTGGTSNLGRSYIAANNDSFDILNEAGTQFILTARLADAYPLFKSNPIIHTGVESLSAAQMTQARQNIYAAPFDAMSCQNILLNGGMEVDQQNNGAAVTIPSNSYVYPCDQWVCGRAHAGGVAGQAVRGVGGAPVGMSFVQHLTSAAMTTIASTDYAYIGQWVEGLRCNKLWWGQSVAQTVVLSFWVYATATGTASVSIRNGAGDRSYVTTFGVTAGTWTYVSKVIPGCTTGTWATDTGIGLSVLFFGAVGSSLQTSTPDTWLTGNFYGITGQSNLFATANNILALSCVTLTIGSDIPATDQYARVRLIRPAPEELVFCQRYWQKLDLPLYGFYATGGSQNVYNTFIYATEMRVAPTVGTITAPSTLQNVSSWTLGAGGQISSRSIRADLFNSTTGVCYEQGGVYALNARLV